MAGLHIIGVVTVVIQRHVVPPAAVLQAGGQIDIDLTLLVAGGVLEVQLCGDVALPDHVMHHRPGYQQTLDRRDLRCYRAAIGHAQHDLARLFGFSQLHGVLVAVFQADQHRLFAGKGAHPSNVDRHRPGVFGAQHQLAGIEKLHLAAYTIPIVEPQRIGDTAHRNHSQQRTHYHLTQHHQRVP